MVPFSLFLATKYLKPKRSFISVVTFISILGVILGVAILVIVQSVMTGFDNMWREKILSFKPHLTITSYQGVIEEPEELCRRIEMIKGVTGVAPTIQTRVLMQSDGRTAAPIVVGIDSLRAPSISKIPENVTVGSFDVEDENIVMGQDMAFSMRMGVGSEALIYSPMSVTEKDEVYLPEEVQVSGIFNMGMRDYDSGFVLCSLGVARELVGLEKGVHSIYVMTDDPFLFKEYSLLIGSAIGDDYYVRTWREVDSVLFAALSHEKTMMFILLVFISVVAIFCVTNTLIVITVQKTNEIGLLKALGFSSGQIMGAFVLHGVIQCTVGTFTGIGAGLLVLCNLRNIVSFLTRFNVEAFPKEIYGLAEIPWSTSFSELATIAAFVMVLCSVLSILPALRAARLDPVQALRSE